MEGKEDCEVGRESDSQNEVKEVTHSQSLHLQSVNDNPEKHNEHEIEWKSNGNWMKGKQVDQ